jgi:hypothetical protein
LTLASRRARIRNEVEGMNHPLVRIVFAAISVAVHLITVAATSYGVWTILTHWSLINFTRVVVLLFCVWIGGMSLAVLALRAIWLQRLLLRASRAQTLPP